MDEELLFSMMGIFLFSVLLLSISSLFYLWRKSVSGRPLLQYQPRRSVPWNLVLPALGFFIPSLLIQLLWISDQPMAMEMTAKQFMQFGSLNILVNVLTVAVLSIFMVYALKCTDNDMGLPSSPIQLVKDLFIGFFASLAFLVPIYFVQLVLSLGDQSREQHPLIEQLQESYSPEMLQVTLVMSIVAAPIYEEFVFRLLFQGWLEKWEQNLLQARYLQEQRAEGPENPGIPEGVEQGIFPWLPQGWAPILISGILFGSLHMGQGSAAPVSLSLFGILLGYLYQRTHRIMPCIAAHMLFNGFTMTLLWLQIQN